MNFGVLNLNGLLNFVRLKFEKSLNQSVKKIKTQSETIEFRGVFNVEFHISQLSKNIKTLDCFTK